MRWLLFLLVGVSPAFACDYCLLYQGSSPLETNGFSVRIDTRYLVLNSRFVQNHRVENPSGAAETYWTTQLSAIIPLVQNTSLLLSFPVSRRTSTEDAHASAGSVLQNRDSRGGHALRPVAFESAVDDRAVGIGDATALVRYRFWHRMGAEWVFSATAAAGLKLPTGLTTAHNALGDYVDAHIQPGSGSLDPVIGVSGFAGAELWGFSASVFGWFPGPGVRGYRFGNIVNAQVGTVYGVLPELFGDVAVFAGVDIGGEWHAAESQDGIPDENTGGSTVYFAPLLRADFSHISVEAGAQIPIDHSLRGEQFGETYRLSAGVQYRL